MVPVPELSGNAVRDMTSMVPEALVDRIRRGPEAERQLRAEEDERRFLTGQKIREEQRITERLAQEAVGLEEQLGKRSEEARATRRAQTVAEPEFKPSKMELDDYRNLAGMLVGLGMLAGTSGKSGAMYALNSLNGMMKGFAEGRRDLFKNEQVQFEKQLKSIEATNKRVQRDFEDAMSLLQTDRQLGLAKMQRLKAELGNSVAGIALQLNDLDAVRSNLQRQVTSSEKATADLAKLIEMQEERKARAETEKERLEEARLRREETARRNKEMENIARERLVQQKGKNSPTSALLAGRAENIREAFAQAAADIVNITKFPPGTMLGALAGLTGSSGDTLIKGIRNSIARNVTETEQRMLQQLIAGIEGHLAFALGGGYATSQSKARMDQYKEQIARAGDRPENAALFLARLKQEMNILAENFESKPGATREMNAAVQKYNQNINYAVPFSVDDVIQATLRREDNKPSNQSPPRTEIPPRPPDVPSSAGWSPSAKKWFWQDSEGKTQSKPGKPGG